MTKGFVLDPEILAQQLIHHEKSSLFNDLLLNFIYKIDFVIKKQDYYSSSAFISLESLSLIMSLVKNNYVA